MLMIHELQKIKKRFLWGNLNPKTKYSTWSKDYKNGAWKGADIFWKVISLQCAWIRKFYNVHEWKINFHGWKKIHDCLAEKLLVIISKFIQILKCIQTS